MFLEFDCQVLARLGSRLASVGGDMDLECQVYKHDQSSE